MVGVYFSIDQPAPTQLTLPTGLIASRTVQLPARPEGPGASATITNSNVFFGVWVKPGTHLTLKDSDLGLFLSFVGAGSASGLSATPSSSAPETRTVALSDRTLNLDNTRISVLVS